MHSEICNILSQEIKWASYSIVLLLGNNCWIVAGNNIVAAEITVFYPIAYYFIL